MATLQSRSVRRREDVRLLTGKGNYSADPHPPGMLHAVLVRSHHAHAAIGGIDVGCGARHAWRGGGIHRRRPDRRGADPRRHRLSAPRRRSRRRRPIGRCWRADRVRFVGEPVAVVLSETIDAGKDAAEAVMVDYRELPLVTDAVAALEPASPKVWDDVPDNIGFLWKRGDADGDRRGAAVGGACGAAAVHRLARHRQHDGAARRLGGCRRGRPDGDPCRAPVAVQSAQRHGERQFQHQADRYPRADHRCRRLVRHEVRRAAGIRAGGLGGAQAGPAGALDLRSHRGFPQRRAGARDAHHGGTGRSMPSTNSPR